MIKKGAQVSIHYVLTVDGKVHDKSEAGDPLSYTHGEGMLVDGLEEQILGLKKGDKKSVVVSPEKGYGAFDPKAVRKLSRSAFPKNMALNVGDSLTLDLGEGEMDGTIKEVTASEVTLDFNHSLAGKTLNFDIEVVDVK